MSIRPARLINFVDPRLRSYLEHADPGEWHGLQEYRVLDPEQLSHRKTRAPE